MLPGTRSEGTLPSSRGVGGDLLERCRRDERAGMRSALLTPLPWGAPSDAETGEGGRKSRGRGLRKTPARCLLFVYSHLPQFSLNAPRLSPARERGREAAGVP